MPELSAMSEVTAQRFGEAFASYAWDVITERGGDPTVVQDLVEVEESELWTALAHDEPEMWPLIHQSMYAAFIARQQVEMWKRRPENKKNY